MGNRLYVGNLSYNTSRESLEAAFAGSGEVREVAMPTDRETGRGFSKDFLCLPDTVDPRY